eukprot:1055669-Pleurochrysis_carterae.AAC.3
MTIFSIVVRMCFRTQASISRACIIFDVCGATLLGRNHGVNRPASLRLGCAHRPAAPTRAFGGRSRDRMRRAPGWVRDSRRRLGKRGLGESSLTESSFTSSYADYAERDLDEPGSMVAKVGVDDEAKPGTSGDALTLTSELIDKAVRGTSELIDKVMRATPGEPITGLNGQRAATTPHGSVRPDGVITSTRTPVAAPEASADTQASVLDREESVAQRSTGDGQQHVETSAAIEADAGMRQLPALGACVEATGVFPSPGPPAVQEGEGNGAYGKFAGSGRGGAALAEEVTPTDVAAPAEGQRSAWAASAASITAAPAAQALRKTNVIAGKRGDWAGEPKCTEAEAGEESESKLEAEGDAKSKATTKAEAEVEAESQ